MEMQTPAECQTKVVKEGRPGKETNYAFLGKCVFLGIYRYYYYTQIFVLREYFEMAKIYGEQIKQQCPECVYLKLDAV